MAIEQFRLLAAIMFADIVGYTKLMQEDEAKAKKIRDQQRQVLVEYIDRYHGRIIQYYGDGTLSIFGSALEAVKCAVKIQHKLHNDLHISLRIGMHLGDIVFDDEGAYGDAVNVAARIEALSIAGGILISDRINEELKNHPEVKTQFLGEYKLKNVTRRLQIYAVAEPGLTIPSNGVMMAHQELMKRSIAVLPFLNISSDSSNEYFSDGITEEVINALSNIEGLDVASRTSAFTYKGVNKNIREIGGELSVNFILEGSVRKWGDRVRITAQLINVETGYHLWSETFEKNFPDIFDLQDEIAKKIAFKLKNNFSTDGQHLVKSRTENPEAYNEFLRGKYHWHKWTPEDAIKSIEHFKKAVKLCPRFADAYAGIAYSYSYLGAIGRFSPREAYPIAEEAAVKSLKLNDQITGSHLALALVKLFYYWDFEGTKTCLRRALAIKPDSPKVKYVQALYLKIKGKHKAAIRVLTEAVEKNPLSLNINTELACAYLNAGQPVKAMDQYNKTLDLDANFRPALEGKGWAYVALGDYDNALQVFENYRNSVNHKLKGVTQLGYIHGKLGDLKKAQGFLQLLIQRDKDDPDVMLQMDYAVIYLGMGEYDHVFYYLQEALDERLGGILFINTDPIWNEVKTDDRFYDLVKQIGFIKPTVVTEIKSDH